MPPSARQFQVNEASRQSVVLKIGLMGTSGAGKTVSALRLAYGICGDWTRIYVLDTENRSALATVHQVYKGVSEGAKDLTIGRFKHLPFDPPYDPQSYTDAIKQIDALHYKDEEHGPQVLIIDGFWHVWKGIGGLLEIQQQAGNTFAAWNTTNPEQNKVMDAMRLSPLWIIANIRASTEYLIETIQDPKDATKQKQDIKKVGIGPDMRKDTEYEFAVTFMIDRASHMASVGLGKDRTQIWDRLGYSAPAFVITEETGQLLKQWALSGEHPIGSAEWVQATVTNLALAQNMEELRIKFSAVWSLCNTSLTADAKAILLAKKDDIKARLQRAGK